MKRFEIDKKDLEMLEEKISKLGDNAESETNSIIHDFGFRTLEDKVTDKLPVSSRNKRHAKYSEPFKADKYNLGFDFKTKGGSANKKNSYGYLVFPNEGRGPRNKIAREFTNKGTSVAKPIIMKELLERITNKIQEVI
ncbi:hypothetical protein [Senegalia massiliensis]|uniref:hypothetical protein n=1 Tax=Senegalia massiliensis TaxID=1720316 RepID=UPI001030A04C|nr:hypothetical protein [Senegalia massiliensis]